MAERTFLELQQLVLMHVHGETTTTNVSSQFLTHVKASINRALTEVTNEIKMFHAKRAGQFGLVADQEEYTLPSDVSKILAETVYYNDGSDSFPLRLMTEQDWTRQGGQSVTQTSKPAYYTPARFDSDLRQWVMKIHPKPSSSAAGKTVRFEYYGMPAELSADTDIPPLPDNLHDGLVNGAIVLGFMEYMQDTQVAGFQANAWEGYKRQLRKHADVMMGRQMPFRRSQDQGHVGGRPLTNFTLP